MILQSELSGERLSEEIGKMIESPAVITSMEEAARAMGREDAAEKTADLIEELKRNV